MEDISNDLIRLNRLVVADGVSNFSISELQKLNAGNRRLWNKFTYDLFKNWKKAQREILSIQLTLWKEIPDFQNDPVLNYLYRSTQRILDCILWHHFGPDITDMKRIYDFQPKIQNLFHHNIECHINVMEEINSSTRHFALITDLTSGVRIGDIFRVDKDKNTHFIEVKEGKINAEILNAKSNMDNTTLNKLMSDPNISKQIKRIERQAIRATETIKMLSNEPGQDDRFKGFNEVRTVINPKPFEDISEQLSPFLEKFNKSDGMIDSIEIESCMLIIAYKPFKHMKNFRDLLINTYEKDSELKGLKFEWHETLLSSSIMKPTFVQNIHHECINSIVKGELIVDFYFSLSKFKNFFSNNEINIFFNNGKMFRKDYDSIKKIQGPSPFYDINKGSLYFKFNNINTENAYIFSEGLFLRIISNLIPPSYLIYLHQFMAEDITQMQSSSQSQKTTLPKDSSSK